MKKIKLLSILGMIILLFAGCLSEADRAEKVLQKHLKERYGEEFVIYGMGKRAGNVRRWYEAAVVYPKSYIGTRKENDSYYWGKGFVELNNGMKGGDTYGGVLLNESANEFYGKKLKELFGENYLAVIDLDGYYKYTDFEKEIDRRKKSYEKSPNGVFSPISGGIYIFGRVESDKDREWYRKQIYEFIQFMKETGTFEYVDLDIEVIDEKVLSENFKNNEILKNNLLENRKSWEKDEKDTKNYRDTKKFFLKEIKVNNNEILKNINEINKSQIKKNSLDWSYYNLLLYTKIYSLKYIKSNSLKGEKEKEYNKITDIEFDMGGYY
ncbi:hypothetical protein M2102_001375 [Fusobacterium sp. PH5-7]|uniref:hypothetical protein n=1 Tax=Fusobacterium sp. PH5-7 TaxID=2940528 RepID=UPI002475B885|nr:hypothetical protein [Fusobacterium sp. PH5-7]MDH6457746.1 hypothetical protein [Fusobacterium sp. PH5-7]